MGRARRITAALTGTGAVLALVLAGCGQASTPAAQSPATDRPLPTAPALRAAAAATVVAAGDIACAPGDSAASWKCQQAATADLIGEIDPKRVIALGDTQYEDGRLADYRQSYADSWGRYKKRTHAIPGNHEYHTSRAAGYFGYFGGASPGYHVMTLNGWRVYLLNSNCGDIDCDKQKTWLRNDLVAHPVACSAIALHYPRYSSGQHGSARTMAKFWNIAYNHDVDLALAGHDHHYERFEPMDGRGNQVADGLVSFVVGTGGKSLRGMGTPAPGSAYFRADRFGVLQLKLGTGEFGWRFRTIAGTVRDSGSHPCH